MTKIEDSADVVKIDVEQVLRARLPRLWRYIPHFAVEWLKRVICQDTMNVVLEKNAGKTGAEFCRGILRTVGVTVNVRHAERLPEVTHRRVTFVSNHPLGGLDGMALIDMIQSYYGGRVWFVVNDLLMAVKPLEDVFLPINKFGQQSRQSSVNIETAFAGDDPIIMFPAGLVSRLQRLPDANGVKRTVVHDLEWQKMFVNKCVKHHRDVVPLYFDGENSGDFYRKARLRKRLGLKFNIEMVLLPREMFLQQGASFTVVVGPIRPYAELKGGKDARQTAHDICNEVYRLASQ